MSVSSSSIAQFLNLLSKLGNRKFNPTGICDAGDGLVAVVGILHQIFSCLLETFGTMSQIIFSSDGMSKNIFQQLKIHECLLSFTTSLFWNGWKTMVQKCENDRNFLLYHC